MASHHIAVRQAVNRQGGKQLQNADRTPDTQERTLGRQLTSGFVLCSVRYLTVGTFRSNV